MLKLSYLKMALNALDNHWDFTLNTDGSFESERNREAILKRHYIHNSIGLHRPTPEFYEALDAYLDLRRVVDEIEASEMDNVAIHVSKFEPNLRGLL